MNILIVDDDDEIRFVAAFMLRDAGHDVREAGDGAGALAAVHETVPDVVLMDLMLGNEDGIIVADQLRGHAGASLRVVFLTGASRPDQVARLEAAGGAGVLQKPFDPAALPQQLNDILEGGR